MKPHVKTRYPSPKFRFECRALDHPGASIFFSNNQPARDLSSAVKEVLSILYDFTESDSHVPPTRSVTLILRPMAGVAYTTGIELDDDHKEMHFSLDYIRSIASNTPGREIQEIQGVLVHEMVHAWQWNGLGTAPGGLIEGIADFVRLKAGLSPPHWKREATEKWDQGYHHTAYFLEWIEEQCGEGSVRRINHKLKDKKYDEEKFWSDLFERKVETLWEDYKSYLEKHETRERKAKHTMSENAFWHWVKERKGSGEMVVLKAIWRTKGEVQERRKGGKNDLQTELDRLWSQYVDSPDVKDEGLAESVDANRETGPKIT